MQPGFTLDLDLEDGVLMFELTFTFGVVWRHAWYNIRLWCRMSNAIEAPKNMQFPTFGPKG